MTFSAIVLPAAGSRALVRTVENVRRTGGIERITIARHAPALSPIVASLEARLGVSSTTGPTVADAVNAACARAETDALLIVPAGCRVAVGCVAALAEAIAACGAAMPAWRIESSDALRSIARAAIDPSVAGLLARPDLVPPVLAVTRAAWMRTGGFDPRAGALAPLELTLALVREGDVRVVPRARVTSDATLGRWPSCGDDAAHLECFRHVVEKHRAAVEREMIEILVRRETGFGTLRETHRELVARRDSDLEHLDDLRSRAAHATAWLAHRGLDDLDWGDLRQPDPIDRDWGYRRGGPVDRHYIERFLASHSSDLRGRVLEVQEDHLSRMFGGPRVERVDVLDLDDANARATILADLRCAPHLPDDTYDCVVLTQTLHVIDDIPAALGEVRRVLAPAGVLLATLPCASRVCVEYGDRGDLWRITPDGARHLFEGVFGSGSVEITTFGNVLANVAFLEGAGRAELDPSELDVVDPFFPALVGVRVRKTAPPRPRPVRGLVLLYHRVADERDRHDLTITPAEFEAHLAWLRGNCSVVSLGELLGTPVADLPERAVAITFDDGYVDNLDRAAPALVRAGLPATFFVTSRWLRQPGEFWWDLLDRVLAAPDLPAFLRVDAAGGHLEVSTSSGADRQTAHRTLHGFLVNATLPEREHVVAALRGYVPAPGARRPMLAEEVQQLARHAGASIGAHTVHHLSLASQPLQVARQELDACRTALEAVLGAPVSDMAYPYGAASAAVRDLVRGGWRWGCACGEQAVGEAFDSAWVGRVDAGVLDAGTLAARVGGLFGDSLGDPRSAGWDRHRPVR